MGPKDKKEVDKNQCILSSEEINDLNPTVGSTVGKNSSSLTSFEDFYCYNNPECYDCSFIDSEVETVEILNEFEDYTGSGCFDDLSDDLFDI